MDCFLPGDFYYISVTGEKQYDYNNLRIIPPSMNYGSFSFEVMACSDATVGLFDYVEIEQGSYPSYEIVIGGEDNTKTYIRRGDQSSLPDEQVEDTPGILSCTDYVAFYIEWGPGGFIINEVNGPFFFSWWDRDPLPILHISLTSTINSGQVVFKVPGTSGK